jgi:hypothetical protein
VLRGPGELWLGTCHLIQVTKAESDPDTGGAAEGSHNVQEGGPANGDPESSTTHAGRHGESNNGDSPLEPTEDDGNDRA